MKKVISANYAAAYGAKMSRVQMVAAYPITPQTTVVEKIAELCANGEMPARLIKVESEHSSMSACIGASAVGARVFTATSSQGLVYMHEMLHWAAGSRLPIVMVNANRSLAAPWNMGSEQIDSLSQRDTSWIQFYCENNQEVLDTVIQAYRVAETVSLPVMVNLDGYFLSHTYEAVDIPDAELVDKFLPPRKPLYKLEPGVQMASGGACNGDQYTHFRYTASKSMHQAKSVAKQALAEFEEIFGRKYGLIQCDNMDNADIAVIAAGSMAGTIRQVLKDMGADGKRIGLIKLRMFKPFPREELIEALSNIKKVVVIDRDATLDIGGIVCQEVKAALYGHPGKDGKDRPVFGFIAGLGGMDITPHRIRRMFDYVLENDSPTEEPLWVEVKS